MNTEEFPLVSVICNCYNHESYIYDALESVANQSYTNIELIVINNGSKDNSYKVIKEFIDIYPRASFINLFESISHNMAFNMAFKRSNGKYLVDLSGDDRLLPQCIERQVSFFNQQEESVGLIFGNAYSIDKNGLIISPYFSVDNNNKVLNKRLFQTTYESILLGGLCMCSVSAMMSRKHFELINGYDENLVFEDLDYWLRLSYQYKIKFLDEFLVEKRELNDSFGKQQYKINKFDRNINNSIFTIYNKAIKRNNWNQNKYLIQRINYSIYQCYKRKNWKDFLVFILISMKCRLRIYFKYSKNSSKSLM